MVNGQTNCGTSIHLTSQQYKYFGKGKNIGTNSKSVVTREEWREEIDQRGAQRNFFRKRVCYIFFILVLATGLYAFVKIHKYVHFKKIRFTVRKLYLNTCEHRKNKGNG